MTRSQSDTLGTPPDFLPPRTVGDARLRPPTVQGVVGRTGVVFSFWIFWGKPRTEGLAIWPNPSCFVDRMHLHLHLNSEISFQNLAGWPACTDSGLKKCLTDSGLKKCLTWGPWAGKMPSLSRGLRTCPGCFWAVRMPVGLEKCLHWAGLCFSPNGWDATPRVAHLFCSNTCAKIRKAAATTTTCVLGTRLRINRFPCPLKQRYCGLALRCSCQA